MNAQWIEKYRVARKLALFITLGLTVVATLWAMGFAEASEKPGAEIAMIIGAITGPLTLLQSSIFKLFVSGERHDDQNPTQSRY